MLNFKNNNDKKSQHVVEIGKNNYIVTASINTLIFKKVQILDDELVVDDTMKYPKRYRTIDQYVITLQSLEDIRIFKSLLNNSYENKVFEYKGVNFDFTNYDRKSVDHIIDQVAWIERFIPKYYLI